jgi:hypothetical protein
MKLALNQTRKTTMKRSPKKTPEEKAFNKRRTIEEGLKLADAAHVAVWRLYCDVFAFWRACLANPCRRHRRCQGEPAACLMRGLPSVPRTRLIAAEKEVAAGGPRLVPPATHLEYVARREPLPLLTTWRLGSCGIGSGKTRDNERMAR